MINFFILYYSFESGKTLSGALVKHVGDIFRVEAELDGHG